MEALFAENGQVHCWLDEENGRLIGLQGENLAFIDEGGVFSWTGDHFGWWENGTFHDNLGRLCLVASKVKLKGTIRPKQIADAPPLITAPVPKRPARRLVPTKPSTKLIWAEKVPF